MPTADRRSCLRAAATDIEMSVRHKKTRTTAAHSPPMPKWMAHAALQALASTRAPDLPTSRAQLERREAAAPSARVGHALTHLAFFLQGQRTVVRSERCPVAAGRAERQQGMQRDRTRQRFIV